jgi:hypothetical protein
VACSPHRSPAPIQCNGDRPQYCDAAGWWQDHPADFCPIDRPFCAEGRCSVCRPSSEPTRCSNNVPQFCASVGDWRDADTCPLTAPNCRDGKCYCDTPNCPTGCKDLNQDGLNCGACDHVCESRICNGAKCAPHTLATGTEPLSIAVDATNVYWTDFEGVWSVPLGGGVPPLVRGSSLGWGSGLAVNATDIYWNDEAGNVMRVALLGGTPMTLARQPGFLGAMALDANNVYWAVNEPAGAVMKLTIGGGTPSAIASNWEHPIGLALGATEIYWTTGSLYGPSRSVMSAPIDGVDGGSPTTLSSGEGAPRELAVDAEYIYWTDYETSNVMRMGRAPGSSAALLGVGPDTAAGYAIAVDATHVYWGTRWEIMRVGRNGGTASTFAPGFATAIALDSTHVYWIDSHDYTIKRLPK